MPSNRERLIEAASLLFHQRGYHATSIDDVLEATGVSRSNLYYHFESKADLAVAVAAHWTRIYDAELVEPSLGRRTLSPVDRLRRLYERAAASQDAEAGLMGCPLGRLANDLATGEPRVRALLVGYFDRLRDRVRETLAESGVVAPGDPASQRLDRLAEACVAVLEGGLLLSHLRGEAHGILAAGSALVALLEPSSVLDDSLQ